MRRRRARLSSLCRPVLRRSALRRCLRAPATAAALCAVLLAVLTSAAGASAQLLPSPTGPLVINEIFYAPTPADGEFIELTNRSGRAVDLSTCTYADATGDADPIARVATDVAPGARVVIARDSTVFSSRFPEVTALYPSGWNGLNNGGDEVVIRCEGRLSDRVPYDDTWGGRGDRSLERIDPNGPSTDPSNFATSTAARGATPGARNSRYNPDIEAPELLFADEAGPGEAVLLFSEPLAGESVVPGAFRVGGRQPERAVLAGRTVRLFLQRIPDGTATVVVQGVRDGRGNQLDRSERPLARRPRAGDLVINEILFAPVRDAFDRRADQVEYVELANASERLLSLRRLALTGPPDETGTADTLAVGGAQASIASGYIVAFAAPTPGGNPARTSQLARAFPDVDLTAATVALLPVPRSTLGLRNTGDRILLSGSDGHVLDAVSYDPAWHAPDLADTRGIALERISASAASDDPANWTSSAAPAGGTPGEPNSVRLPSDSAGLQDRLSVAPSPFSIERDGATRIRYVLDTVPATLRIRIFDSLGRPVRTLESGRLAARSGEVLWDGRGDDGRRLRIGIYVVVLEAVSVREGRTVRLKEPVVLARPLG